MFLIMPLRPSFSVIRWVGVLALAWMIPMPVEAAIVLRVRQVGGDVLISGSGSANTAALISTGAESQWTNLLTDTQLYAGPDAFSDGQVSLFSGLVGPLVFGNDPVLVEYPSATGSGGDLFGIVADNGSSTAELVLPSGYQSGASLSGASYFTGRTPSQLGFIPGQVITWTWGSGSTADHLRLEVDAQAAGVPGPSALPVLATGYCMARRCRRRIGSSLYP
jgi:hypothetical protein